MSLRMDCNSPIPPADLHQHPSQFRRTSNLVSYRQQSSKACIVGAASTTPYIEARTKESVPYSLHEAPMCSYALSYLIRERNALPRCKETCSESNPLQCCLQYYLHVVEHVSDFEQKSEQDVASLLRCVSSKQAGLEGYALTCPLPGQLHLSRNMHCNQSACWEKRVPLMAVYAAAET